MADEKLNDEIKRFRMLLKENPRIRLEIIAAILKVLRDNKVDISDSLLRNLQFATHEEIDPEQLSSSIDPKAEASIDPKAEPSIDPK